MARPLGFTPGEDKIIMDLAGRPALIVNAALKASGFNGQTPRALTRRRWYLKQQDAKTWTAGRAETEIIRLEQRRTGHTCRIEQLEHELANETEQRRQVGQQLEQAIAIIRTEDAETDVRKLAVTD